MNDTTVREIIRWADTTDLRQISVSMIHDWMVDLLPYEKQIIKKAFTDGRIEAFKTPSERIYITAENYYRTLYGAHEDNEGDKEDKK